MTLPNEGNIEESGRLKHLTIVEPYNRQTVLANDHLGRVSVTASKVWDFWLVKHGPTIMDKNDGRFFFPVREDGDYHDNSFPTEQDAINTFYQFYK